VVVPETMEAATTSTSTTATSKSSSKQHKTKKSTTETMVTSATTPGAFRKTKKRKKPDATAGQEDRGGEKRMGLEGDLPSNVKVKQVADGKVRH